jgi:hypothetical protein
MIIMLNYLTINTQQQRYVRSCDDNDHDKNCRNEIIIVMVLRKIIAIIKVMMIIIIMAMIKIIIIKTK